MAAPAIYQPRGSVRPWTSGVGGLYTDTKSWGVAAFQKAYLGGDKYRVTRATKSRIFHLGEVSAQLGNGTLVMVASERLRRGT